MSMEKPWWQRPLRIIQPNLQVRDTARIEPERLAAQLEEMGANTVVFNVGGIYAWYRTAVDYHHANEQLPEGRDLLAEVIEACHKRGIRFVARFDFSKAADWIYLSRPEWFVRRSGGEPEIIGAKRPGDWSLLMTTCINGGYRNEAVALPVLDEVIGRYEIDGVFFNNPQYAPCECDGCKRKYASLYGKPLPAVGETPLEPDWASRCMRDNMERMHRFIKARRDSLPMILYYNLYKDNLFDRMATADLLCIEPQDVLSLGVKHIPEFWKPALSVKLGRSAEGRPAPLGIVHSCPGMDWRHTGLPPAEYAFWLAQIPAYGGSVWHSLTGVPDTIRDKRILRTVTEHNEAVKRIEPYMADAAPVKETALLWNAKPSAEGWAEALIAQHLPFDVLLDEQATDAMLAHYRVLIVPEDSAMSESLAGRLRRFVEGGGHLHIEGRWPADRWGLADLLGIEPDVYAGESLVASYLRFEAAEPLLQRGMEETEWIPHRGRVVYCRPRGAETLASLVPPFSPLESVGAPPERASHTVDRTDIPLLLRHRIGAGAVWYYPFSISRLITDYRLADHYRLVGNAIDAALGERRQLTVSGAYPGLQLTAFRTAAGGLLIHLVNGAGRRPLTEVTPLHGIELTVRRAPGMRAAGAEALIGGTALPLREGEEGDTAIVTVEKLEVWECVHIIFRSDAGEGENRA